MSMQLFEIVPNDFFKPLTSKYKYMYSDAILLIFNSFKPEISYGVNREIVVKELMDYFDADDDEISFDDENYVSDSREKANGVIAQLKNCGWLEYEQSENHQVNVVLTNYSIPFIEAMNRVIKDEEVEYQGIISQIYASLQNDDLYSKPYELVIMPVIDNTERLISELKKLSSGIKKHMDKQTGSMDANEILEHFFKYHNDIGSKAYLRLKTGDNIAFFRNPIISKLNNILDSAKIMDKSIAGYMEINQTTDPEEARDKLINQLLDVKSAMYRLDDIIDDIDAKHSKYMRNAVMRARFLLSTGNSLEGKIENLLKSMVDIINQSSDANALNEENASGFSIYTQRFLSPESLRTIPVRKEMQEIGEIRKTEVLSKKERELYKEALRQKNRRRFSRKNINSYVTELLKDKEKIPVTEVPIESKRDLIRIIYIDIYGGNRANNYSVKRSSRRVKIGEYEIPFFEIIKK